ncbi:MAG: efflux RND transporter periplasmic adaptor subunit [Steroidobacteraceae bacterium]
MAFDTAEDRGLLARYRWYFLAAAGAAAVAWMGYRAWRPIPVGVVEARQGPAERVLAITGRTRPQVTVTIVPKVGGQIVRLAKEEGQAVRAGELLVQLDADAPRAAVEEAQSKIAAQERAVQEAGRNHDRVAQLRERGLATVKEFEQARFDLDQARAELQRLQASRREVSAKLADATIVAPVSGVVLARPVDPGQVVAAQTVIYEIAPLADVEVEADVDEQFLAEVHEGLQADVLVAGRAEPVAATLYYVSPKVDPRTGGAKVRLRFDQRVEGLRSGLTADVNLVVERRDRAITVARSAILGREATARVQVVERGVVQERKVRFLEWPSDRVIVLAGLAPGQQLLAQPRPDLIGQRVEPTTDLAHLPRGRQPRGSDARRAL